MEDLMEINIQEKKEESFISGVKRFDDNNVTKVYIAPEDAEIPDHIKTVEDIDSIVKMAEDIFEPENVHTAKNRIYIRFPEIEMTNSLGYKHKIYDLIVRLTVVISKTSCSGISFDGMRAALTVDEMECNYSHSHLATGSYGKFTSFCLGASDFSLIKENARIQSNVVNWKILLMSIENFVSWESLEGGPHFRMEGIKKVDNVNNEAAIKKDIIDRMIPLVSSDFIDFDQFTIIRGYAFDQFINKNAAVRNIKNAQPSKERQEKAYNKLTLLGKKMVWREEYIDFRIVVIPEDVTEEETTSVNNSIKDIYLIYLEVELKEFFKNYKHEYNKKRKHRPHYFLGKTKADHNRETTGANRLSSR